MKTRDFIENIAKINEHSVTMKNGEELSLINTGMTQFGLYHLFKTNSGKMFRVYKADAHKINSEIVLALFNGTLTKQAQCRAKASFTIQQERNGENTNEMEKIQTKKYVATIKDVFDETVFEVYFDGENFVTSRNEKIPAYLKEPSDMELRRTVLSIWGGGGAYHIIKRI